MTVIDRPSKNAKKYSATRYNEDLSSCKETPVQVCGGPLPVDVHAATNVTAKRAAVNDASVPDRT